MRKVKIAFECAELRAEVERLKDRLQASTGNTWHQDEIDLARYRAGGPQCALGLCDHYKRGMVDAAEIAKDGYGEVGILIALEIETKAAEIK